MFIDFMECGMGARAKKVLSSANDFVHRPLVRAFGVGIAAFATLRGCALNTHVGSQDWADGASSKMVGAVVSYARNQGSDARVQTQLSHQ